MFHRVDLKFVEAVLCRVEYWWRRVRRVVVGVVLLEAVMLHDYL